jgi:hypothetical protein
MAQQRIGAGQLNQPVRRRRDQAAEPNRLKFFDNSIWHKAVTVANFDFDAARFAVAPRPLCSIAAIRVQIIGRKRTQRNAKK